MTYDIILNIILFTSRVATFILTAILGFNLVYDWRKNINESNGLKATRAAIIILTVALLIENGLYMLSYLHGGFTTLGLNRWLSSVKPMVIMVRLLVFYAFWRLFLLFCCNGRKK